MTYQAYITAQLAGFAIHEGWRHGGIDNMLAVAHVIRNRVSAGWAGGDWTRVLETAPGMRGTEYAERVPIDARNVTFRDFLRRIDDVYHDTSEDRLTEGALYYAELHNITSPWFEENILEDRDHHPILAKVGGVTFFG